MLEPDRIVAGRYQAVRLLGRGGMGEVWAARRLAIGDLVALKRLLPHQDTPNNRRRFAIEAQAAAHIRHPNVVQIFDYEEDDAIGPYLVMELLEGHSLADELAGGRPALDRALWIFAGACAAAEAGHRRGIVHRDLKPGNIFIARADDGREQVKVVDFGIALDVARDRKITTPGTVVGTASYLAPELIEGRAATSASDIFSLGVVLYELVCNARPFTGASSMDVMLAISGGRYRPPEAHAPNLPRAVVAAIDAALAREPQRRPPSPEALARMAGGGVAPISAAVVGTDDRAPPSRTRDTGDAAPMVQRFVGREAELAQIASELDAALAGRARIVLVTGDAGAGKSRLLERAAVWAGERGAAVVSARFVDPGAGRPPPLETFAQLIRTPLPDVDDPWQELAAIADGLAVVAGGRPLVIALDDLQWATRLDLDVIAHLHRALAARGTLIIGAARPPEPGRKDELARWRVARLAAIAELALAPLDEDDLRAWLDGAFRGLDLAPVDLRRLHRATGGSPYVIGELLRHLVARGAIARGEIGWRLDPDAELALPDSVAALWRARLAELDPAHRRVLEVAAVLGDEVRVDVLAAATGATDAELDAAIDGAFARRLLTDRGVAPGHDARFTSAPVRDVLLGDLAPRARRRAHQAAITALRAIVGEDRAAHALVHHHHAVGEWAAAVRAGVRASAVARARFDLDAAATALERAEDAAMCGAAAGFDLAPVEQAALDRESGAIALASGRVDDAVIRLERAATVAAELGDRALALDARCDLARAHLARGDHADARTAADATAAEAAAAGDRGRAIAARAVAAEIAMRQGGDLPMFDALLAELGERDPAALRARVHRVRAWARMKQGDWAGATADARRALDLARAAGDLATQQLAMAAMSAIKNESGDPVSAVDSARESLALARRLGDRRREAICMANLADTLIGADDLPEAEALLRGALAIFVAIGDEACEGDCRVNLGRALLALGLDNEAVPVLERGAALCAQTGRREFEGVAHLHLGDAHLAADPARALAAYRWSAELLAASHQRWRAELGAARACIALGDRDGARPHTDRARALLESLRTKLSPGRDPAAYVEALASLPE